MNRSLITRKNRKKKESTRGFQSMWSKKDEINIGSSKNGGPHCKIAAVRAYSFPASRDPVQEEKRPDGCLWRLLKKISAFEVLSQRLFLFGPMILAG
jgi:hypothetical protein